jgi:hypothetical protein
VAGLSSRIRAARGFYAGLAALDPVSRRSALSIGGFVIEALELNELEVLDDWAIPGHADCFAFALGRRTYLATSVQHTGGLRILTFERTGGPEILRQPRAATSTSSSP